MFISSESAKSKSDDCHRNHWQSAKSLHSSCRSSSHDEFCSRWSHDIQSWSRLTQHWYVKRAFTQTKVSWLLCSHLRHKKERWQRLSDVHEERRVARNSSLNCQQLWSRWKNLESTSRAREYVKQHREWRYDTLCFYNWT